ncbi:hypothetical protein Glove_180g11 [Diversispora epigaea]|uniref:Transcription and mRNA export factor SUS1 n=1 Tax=Diversispora epigaea TaxID=1348612 RepID=A0A397IWA7_9GLOM|nr:hypothetical protein Glove_180g11 [Diversispora epigaea]
MSETTENEPKYKLYETSTKHHLKSLLVKKLRDSGWTNNVKKRCGEIIKAEGADKIKISQLEDAVLSYGREMLPEEVKIELLQQISDSLDSIISSKEKT